jgi:hypothetical protein
MAQFRALFDEALPSGTELVFSKVLGGKLVAEIGGKNKGEIADPALARALFAVYLDASPVVERPALVANLPAVCPAPRPSPKPQPLPLPIRNALPCRGARLSRAAVPPCRRAPYLGRLRLVSIGWV